MPPTSPAGRARRWIVADAHGGAAELAALLKISPLIAQILLNRGLIEPADCADFLQPSLKLLHEPSTMPGLNAAAERIARSIRDREKIVVYGDYDVDGITATSILWHAIRQLGGVVEYYIPHRIEEGYGLSIDAIGQICDGGAKLIVSVDCGITALEPARVARQRGVDLIITDHHEWKTDPAGNPLLPDCCGIVHPRLAGATYANPHLCGAGVAFKLAWGVGLAVSGASKVSPEFRQFLKEATALAALGTIADVVPLVGENRVLAHYGLSGLVQSRLPGIQELIASAGLEGKEIDSFHVGFLLAPRLNASGRMGHAALAVRMLTEATSEEAREAAAFLEQQNRQRQTVERQILDEALEQVAERGFDGDGEHAIVLGKAGWHPGIIGIVASRIVDRFHRPTLMIALTGGEGGGAQGSGRSISGFHLAHALESCGEHLDAFGGHAMAAGLKMSCEKFEAFREAFCAHAKSALAAELLIPQLKIDAVAELREMTPALVTDLNRLAPFGQGNRRPVLVLRGLTVAGPPRIVGKTGEHLQFQVRTPASATAREQFMKCIAFKQARMADQLDRGVLVDVAVEPVLNEFNGRSNVELEVKDIRICSKPIAGESLPQPPVAATV
jgi:single-stranded-DNA-specific exonuclease